MTKNFALLLLLFLAIGCTETENPKQDLIPSDAVEIGDQVWMKKTWMSRYSKMDCVNSPNF